MSTNTILLVVVIAIVVIGAIYFMTRPSAATVPLPAGAGGAASGNTDAGEIVAAVGGSIGSIATAIANAVSRGEQARANGASQEAAAAS